MWLYHDVRYRIISILSLLMHTGSLPVQHGGVRLDRVRLHRRRTQVCHDATREMQVRHGAVCVYDGMVTALRLGGGGGGGGCSWLV